MCDNRQRRLYFAPLEGITGHIYRNVFAKHFPLYIDKYFAPFISPGVNQILSKKELRDILPENNKNIKLIPQILANNAQDFLLAATSIQELGYREINLNLGCPSGTVVSKKKGSGMLAYPEELDRLLDGIYSNTNLKISVKTRIGKESAEEFSQILDIYNRYPMEELIIHPRVQKDFYKNKPNLESFEEAVKKSTNTLCYNGDIVNQEDYQRLCERYPHMDRVMIGRGFLRNPQLAEQLVANVALNKEKFKAFHDELFAAYVEEMSGERPVLFKMKELWSFFITIFEDSEKFGKKIRKAEKLVVYREVVEQIFAECQLLKQ